MAGGRELPLPRRDPVSAGQPSGRPSDSAWVETALLVLSAAVILILQTRTALDSYFFGENFLYLGQYRANGGDLWRAIWSTSDAIFFRPVFFLFSLPWHFVLPVEPAAYHVRNLVFSLANVMLLHRLLVHLTASTPARVIAVLFFAVSKVHFTTVGYINIYDSIVMLMLLLLTLLFLLRFLERSRRGDLALALSFCVLSVFSKDHGLVVVAVVAAFALSHGNGSSAWRDRLRRRARLLVLFLLIIPVYLFVRFSIVAPGVPSDKSLYSPGLSLTLSASKVFHFTTTLANLSFRDDGTNGASGLGGWLGTAVSRAKWVPSAAEGMLLMGFLLLVFLTFRQASRPFCLLVPPLVWIAAYLGPTLLVRNVQMYYAYEAVAGVAVLLATCLESGSRRMIATWSLALVLIGANAVVSNYRSRYHWQSVAREAERIRRPVVEAYRGRSLESVTFATSSLPLLQYALTSDLKGPMIPELLRLPDLVVRVVEPEQGAILALEADSRNLVLDADDGFARLSPKVPVSLVLRGVSPSRVAAGSGFNVQADGRSAVALSANAARPGTVVVLDGQPLATVYGNAQYLTALIPESVLRNPGRYSLYLRDGERESNRVDFVVIAAPPGTTKTP